MIKKGIKYLITAIATSIVILIVLEVKAQKDQLIADVIVEIDSELLGESRKLLIHLPKGYGNNSSKTYPVIVALDGTSHDQEVVNTASILNYAKIFPEVIIVGIPNTDRKRDLTPHYLIEEDNPDNLGQGDKFLEFLEKEAIPLIEQKYRASGYRMITGNSRGGLFSMYALLEKPSLFNAYFCFSPAFWRNNNRIVQKAEEFLVNNPYANAFVYMSLGANENEKMKKGFQAMEIVFSKIQALEFHSCLTPGATHASNSYHSLPLALKTWKEHTQ